MYKVVLKSTRATVTTFRSRYRLGEWLASSGNNGVTHKIGLHPSVDMRDVDIVDGDGMHIDDAQLTYAYQIAQEA